MHKLQSLCCILFLLVSFLYCQDDVVQRPDGAKKIGLSLTGSLQNPAWSPDSGKILFTWFKKGYNKEPADLKIVSLTDFASSTLVSNGSGNVNLPGSSWNPKIHKVVFASSREPHDEIYMIHENGKPGEESRVTSRQDKVAYEPSFSPDGQWIVFESHKLDVADKGVITKCDIGGTRFQDLTDATQDCRQPNWSPAGDLILYQRLLSGQWNIWVTDSNGMNKRQVTKGSGNKTDASFSPDGKWIVYSSDEGTLPFANIYILPVAGGTPVRVTKYNEGYDGAPSWSPDGTQIAFESCKGDPDTTPGTSLWVIAVPVH